MTSTVVVGYDGSAEAAEAVRWAARAADRGRLVIVHARGNGVAAMPGGAADRHVHARLEALWMEEDALTRPAVELRSAEVPPARALCDVAADVDADVIVVGRHHSGPFAPDTVRQLLVRADRPVTVVPRRR